MKLTLSTYGGIAGGLRRPDLVVDSASIPADQAEQIKRLVEAAKGADQAAGAPGPARDALEYEIKIEDGGYAAVIGQSGASMSGPFADLMKVMKAHGKASR